MKVFALILMCWAGVFAKAQGVLQPRRLQVTVNKTTNLIFPAAIVSVDRGSEGIVVQKFTAHILRVKADTAFADTTNLSVITSDGKLYSFLVSYNTSPGILNLDLGAGESIVKDTALVALSKKVLRSANNLHGIRYTSGKVSLALEGIYTDGQRIMFKLRIENNSLYSFELARMKFYTGGLHTAKRRPSQEIDVIPLLVNPSTAIIKERQALVMAVVLPKTGLAAGHGLQCALFEKDGERQLGLRISSRQLLHASFIQ